MKNVVKFQRHDRIFHFQRQFGYFIFIHVINIQRTLRESPLNPTTEFTHRTWKPFRFIVRSCRYCFIFYFLPDTDTPVVGEIARSSSDTTSTALIFLDSLNKSSNKWTTFEIKRVCTYEKIC